VHCYRHPNRPAVAACVRCGNLVCAECDVLAGGRHFCWACVGRVRPAPFAGRRFIRTRDDRVLAGVCGGLARYFRVDPTLVRVLLALAAVFTALVPFALAYLIVALLTPLED